MLDWFMNACLLFLAPYRNLSVSDRLQKLVIGNPGLNHRRAHLRNSLNESNAPISERDRTNSLAHAHISVEFSTILTCPFQSNNLVVLAFPYPIGSEPQTSE